MREKLSVNVLSERGLVSELRGAGCERSCLVVADYLFVFRLFCHNCRCLSGLHTCSLYYDNCGK